MAHSIDINNYRDKGNLFALTKRAIAAPLDDTSFFDSYNNAVTYANTADTAYYGQIIVVIDSTTPTASGVYEIQKVVNDNVESAILKKIADDDDLESLRNEILTTISTYGAGYQGSIQDLVAKTGTNAITRGMIFNVASGELTTYATILAGVGAEEGDWIVVKTTFTYNAQQSIAPYVGVWEKNLTGAITTVSGGTAETGKYVKSVVANNGTITVTKDTLPRELRVSTVPGDAGNAHKYIEGLHYDSSTHKLTIVRNRQIPFIIRHFYAIGTVENNSYKFYPDSNTAAQCDTVEVTYVNPHAKIVTNDTPATAYSQLAVSKPYFVDTKAMYIAYSSQLPDKTYIHTATVEVLLNGLPLQRNVDYYVDENADAKIYMDDGEGGYTEVTSIYNGRCGCVVFNKNLNISHSDLITVNLYIAGIIEESTDTGYDINIQ